MNFKLTYICDAAQSADGWSSELIFLELKILKNAFMKLDSFQLTRPVISLVKQLVTIMTSSAMYAISLMQRYTIRRRVNCRTKRQCGKVTGI